MELWLQNLLLWSGVSTIVSIIIRVRLGDRAEAWTDYLDGLLNYWDSSDITSFSTLLLSVLLLPGVVAAALWDWMICPAVSWLWTSFQFHRAMKKATPFARDCYEKITELRRHRNKLQKQFRELGKDEDRSASRNARLNIGTMLMKLEDDENELWSYVRTRPNINFQVQQQLKEAERFHEEARLLINSANTPEIQQLLGVSHEDEKDEGGVA